MKDSYRHLYAKSQAHLEKGEVGLAVHTLQEALELEPDDTFLLEELFKLCMLAGSPSSALAVALELRRINEYSPHYLYLHGLAALTDGKVEEAALLLEDTLRCVPDSLEVRRALAQTYEVLDRHPRVRELLEAGVAQHPTEPSVVNDLALHLMQHEPDGKRRAEPLLRRVLEAHPEDEATHFNLALALLESNPAAARQHARHAARSEDEDLREQARRMLSQLGDA
jgi:predicted Zn-dependent protease